MKNVIYIIAFVGASGLLSCATILNSDVQNITVSTDKSAKDINLKEGYLVDSLSTKTNMVKEYEVYRSPKPLSIEIKTDDSSMRYYRIFSRLSPVYWLNIPTSLWIGLVVDLSSDKRFAYPSRNYFPLTDSSVREKYRFRYPHPKRRYIYDSRYTYDKGQIDLRIGYYFLNDIGVQYNRFQQDRTGIFAGVNIGADYHTKPNQYLSVDAGAASSYVPCDFCIVPDTTDKVKYLSVRNNHILWRKLDLGYGLNISYYSTSFEYRGVRDTLFTNTRANTSLGLSLSAQYRISPHFSLGFLYQPNIYTVSPIFSGFAYQHYFSFNLNFIIPIKK